MKIVIEPSDEWEWPDEYIPKCPKCGNEMGFIGINASGNRQWYCRKCDHGHEEKVEINANSYEQ